LPTFKMLGVILMGFVFVCLLTGISLYTHPSAYIDKLTKDWGHVMPVVLGYVIAVMFIYFCCMVMFKVTMIFSKAYALMEISSNPMDFIGNEVGRKVLSEMYLLFKKKKREIRTGNWHKFQVFCKEEGVILDKEECLRVIKRPPVDTVGRNTQSDDQPVDAREDKYLNQRLKVLNPQFLMAWMALREHIQKWELRYFYELTQPIVSLEIVFVLAMLLMALIGVFLDPYNGDMRSFFLDMVSENNVVMILLLFMLLVTGALLVHLNALLKPYHVQKSHEAWLENVSMQLQIEQSYRWELKTKQKGGFKLTQEDMWELEAEKERLSSLRELISSMKQEMSENRAAPKLLGVLELNETLIESIIAAITTALTSLVCAFFTGLMTEIGENSGIYPTEEPTYAPTWEPTFGVTE